MKLAQFLGQFRLPNSKPHVYESPSFESTGHLKVLTSLCNSGALESHNFTSSCNSGALERHNFDAALKEWKNETRHFNESGHVGCKTALQAKNLPNNIDFYTVHTDLILKYFGTNPN